MLRRATRRRPPILPDASDQYVVPHRKRDERLESSWEEITWSCGRASRARPLEKSSRQFSPNPMKNRTNYVTISSKFGIRLRLLFTDSTPRSISRHLRQNSCTVLWIFFVKLLKGKFSCSCPRHLCVMAVPTQGQECRVCGPEGGCVRSGQDGCARKAEWRCRSP